MNTSIKLAFRSIRKNKIHSLISILGLGVGLGSIILLATLYIHEKSFDRFIPKYKNVYRITQGTKTLTAYPLAEQLQQDNPQIEDFFRYFEKANVEIEKTPTDKQTDKHFAFADASIFNIIGIPFKSGSAAISKSEVTISESVANQYFPQQNAVGQQLNIKINDVFLPLTISGIYHDFPSNSTLSPRFIANIDLSGEALASNKKMFGDYNEDIDQFKNWDNRAFYTYLRLVPQAVASDVIKSMKKYQDLTSKEELRTIAYSLQPVKDIYLNSDNLADAIYTRQGNAKAMNYYLAIAALILLIAIINYIFLNRAKTETKFKELGAQKALGASNRLLNLQIITESNLVVLISLVPAVLVFTIGVPFINKTLSQSIGINVFNLWQIWPVVLGIILLTGTLSGLFIAQTSSRISPVLLLKGKKKRSPKKSIWGNAILSFHFSIFIILIASVFTLNKQLKFAASNFEGINPHNVLIYELGSSNLSQQYTVIKNEIDKLPGVISSAGSSFIPPFNNFLPLRIPNENGGFNVFDGLIMGQGMLDLLGIEVLEGEAFGEYLAEKPQLIVNESAAKQYDIKAESDYNGIYVRAIVKDFNVHSLHKAIQPMAIIQQNPQKLRLFAVKTDGANNSAILKSIDNIFYQISPDRTIERYWLNDQINHFYTEERHQSELISAFSILAIVLSVMGLLGMTLVSINRKTKEIGIRKVNGAKITEILTMLNKDFIKWVVIAFVIATPIAYYAMHKWLESFAYKTSLSWWIFALAGLLALGIALLTVSWQSWKAATRNPVESLRYE